MKANFNWAIHSLLLGVGAAGATPVVPGEVPAPVIGQRFFDGDAPRWAVRRGPVDGRTAIEVHIPDGRKYPAQIDAHALVRLAPGVVAAEVWAELDLEPVRAVFPRLNLWRVRGRPGEDGLDVAHRLMPHLGGTLVQALPDLYLHHTRHAIEIPPDDPRYAGQWFLDRVDIESAWAISTGAPEVAAVVIDGGCQVAHPDLVDKMDPGRDVASQDDDPNPIAGFPGSNHGTAVAGVVAASTDNGIGVAGACPECRMRCVRLLPEDDAPVPLSADTDAFAFALETGAWVINNSWGFRDAVPVPAPLRDAIREAITEGRDGKGTVVVFAVGNEHRLLGDDELPAVEGVLGVGATNNFDELTQFSNSGRAVDVVAPTGSLTTDLVGADGDDPGDYTRLFGGTSSAAPLVSGIVGLMLAADPERTNDAIIDALTSTAEQSIFARDVKPDGHDDEYGYGVIRPAAALRAYLGLPEPEEMPDAMVPDAAPVDAAPSPDAAAPELDAAPGDAATPTGAESTADDGGCRAAPTRGPVLLALAMLLLMMPRRRRSRREG